VAGNTSSPSAALVLTIDTQAPAAPATPVLDPGSDSGVKGDNLTNVTLPTLTGTAEAGSTVTLYDGSTVLGTTTVNATGAWSFTVSTTLADGAHSLTAIATDVAGNTSPVSAALTLTIDTQPPTISDVTAVRGQSSTTITYALSQDATVTVVVT